MSFELDEFVDACRAELSGSNPQKNIRELMARAVADTNSIVQALGSPHHGEIAPLHVSSDLTILKVIWAPKMTILPHDHAMWTVIGIYGGREDNVFWRRVPGAPEGKIEAAGARSLCNGDAAILGPDIIHSVTNPIARLSAAIHIYGGDFFNAKRSDWNPETLTEGPYDREGRTRQFAEENRRWFATC